MITRSTTEKEMLESGKACAKCGKCCGYGSGFILEEEIPALAKRLGKSADRLKSELESIEMLNTAVYRFRSNEGKHGEAFGPCIMKEGDLCRIHDAKPLHCRISKCSYTDREAHAWFIVNKVLNVCDPEAIRQYNIYVKSGGKVIPGARLEELVPDKEILDSVLGYRRVI